MKNYIAIFIIILLLILIYFEFKPGDQSKTQSITNTAATSSVENKADYLASFAIFTYNSPRNFYDESYYNRSADIYVQADNPNLIYIKKSGLTWGDFFKSLPIEMTEDCLNWNAGESYCNGQGGTFKYFINGKRISHILTEKIHKGDTLLISYGYETADEIKAQIEQVPKASVEINVPQE